MAITVEFFGIPRARAGVAKTTAVGTTLGEVLTNLAERYPEFAISCLDHHQLRAETLANIDGDRFVTDPSIPITDGTVLLILGQDSGG